jgi:hypothetical protein
MVKYISSQQHYYGTEQNPPLAFSISLQPTSEYRLYSILLVRYYAVLNNLQLLGKQKKILTYVASSL